MNTDFQNPVADSQIETICAYCGTGCGVTAHLDKNAEKPLIIKGSSEHPANFGRLCSKGSNLSETLSLDARLLQPQVDGQAADWATAIDTTASRIRNIVDQHGPDAFAIYCSGQLLTEDYYVANKLMKGYIGSANIDTNSRLCMSSTVAGHKRAFGADTVPGCYEDLEQADMVILTGSNTAWCHPVLFQRIRAAKEANPGRITVVIDPRRTATCDIADLHLAIKPGTDAHLFNGLLSYLDRHGALDHDYIAAHTEHFEEALALAHDHTGSIAAVASHCDLAPAEIEAFYRWFMNLEKTVTTYSQGVNQSSSGSDKVNSILNCHLATGRIGKPGMGPLSFTGQPNAMGGREVGGLANQLAAHLDLPNPDHRALVQDYWQSPKMPTKAGYKAVDLFKAIDEGKVKGVWIMATNPVDSLPDADQVRRALENCDLVILSDCMNETDTTALADIRLPAMGWGEKDGTVTNSERCISRHRAIYPPSGEARPDWWIISRVAQAMGYEEAFNFQQAVEVFREHAGLSAYRNSSEDNLRDFNLSAFTDISTEEYQQLQPVQWPVSRDDQGSFIGSQRLLTDGLFFTPNRRGQFIPVTPKLPQNPANSEYPLILNTGRIRDQWHTMTRTGLSPRLSAHLPEPYLEIHPTDAGHQGLTADGLARINSHWGKMLARVRVTDAMRKGEVFVPMHWTEQFASQGRMGALINPVLDPLSGQPESKHTPVQVTPYQAQWHGFLLSRERLQLDAEYQVRAVGQQFHRYELADSQTLDWPSLCQQLQSQNEGDWLEYSDAASGQYRVALIHENQLQAVLVVAPDTALPDRTWLGSLFANNQLSTIERRQLLSCRAPDGIADTGPVVCACFSVGRNTLVDGIEKQGLDSVEAIGSCLKAGTNCGSCIPEIRQLLASHDKHSAA